MRIAYVNNHYHLGGAETVVRQLHEGALAAGHDSRLHVTDGRSWPRARGLRPLYPRLLARLDHSRLRHFVLRVAPRRRWTDRAFRALARSDADLVHLHAFHGIYASTESLAAVAAAKPFVWTFHRFWGVTGGCDHPGDCHRYLAACGDCPRAHEWPMNGRDDTAAGLAKKLRLLAPLPFVIVAPSRHLAAVVRESRVGRGWRVEHIPNGVNLARFDLARDPASSPARRAALGLPSDGVIALVVNREFTDPVKGFSIIRDAAHALSAPQRARITWLLVGGASAHARTALPADARVVDAGFVRDQALLAAYHQAADIFLYASPGENFPCATIEAMATGSCLVTTPTDGVLEQVEHGVSALVAEDFSGPALAARLAAAAESPALRQRLGDAARRRAREDFSEAAMLARHHALYAELLSAGSRPAP